MDTQQKIEQRREDARKRQKKLQKRANSKINYKVRNGVIGALITVAVVVVLFALIFPNTGLSRRVVTAATIGDEKVSAAEFSYYYRNAYTSYYQTMAQYVGKDNVPIDTSKSLKKQEMSEGVSYADYFTQSALESLTRLIVLNEEAEKANFTFPPESEQQYKDAIANVESYAASSNMTADQYLARMFGSGFNMKLFKKCAKRELTAAAWQEYKENEPVYTAEQLEAYYTEHQQEYDYVDFRMVTFKEAAATDTTEAVTAEEAKAAAEEFISKVTDSDSFANAAIEKAAKDGGIEVEDVTDTSLAKNVPYSSAQSIDVNLADWLFAAERTEGETAVVTSASGTTFYAIYMESPAARQDHNTISVRHILFYAPDAEDTEAVETAKQQAEDALTEFVSNGATEEAFAQLANQYSYDTGSNTNGGLYENVYPGDMLEEFDAWCFDPARQPGDYGIVQTDVGFHCMYFVGTGDPKWETEVADAMRLADYDAYYAEVSANYPVKTHALGMMFRSEPI